MKLPGVSCGKPENKMGLIGCATSDIILEDVRVPADCILGEVNKGFAIAMKTLDTGRIGVASQGIGIAQGALDETIKYVKERKQFGKPLSKMQAIAFDIADMQTKLTAAKLMVYEAAAMCDRGENYTMQAAMVSTTPPRPPWILWGAACSCMVAMLHQDYPIERMYCDCKVFTTMGNQPGAEARHFQHAEKNRRMPS